MKAITILLLMFTVGIAGAQTPVEGTVTFSVETEPTYTGFSPKHVLAIWVESDAGTFEKTLKLRADKRKQYLYTWNNKSAGNTTDAITGATLSTHTSHTVTWDCTDKSGQLVPDGDYKIVVEFTSEHAQGPMVSVSFTKSGDEVILSPSNTKYFINMDLVFTPADTTGNQSTDILYEKSTSALFSVYPNPSSGILNLSWNAPENGPVEIQLYDMAMRLCSNIKQESFSGENHLSWTPEQHTVSGNYIVVIRGKNFYASRKVVLTK